MPYKLLFIVHSSQSIALFIGVSFRQNFIYNSLFLYWVWLSFLFHICQSLWILKFAEVKSEKYVTAYVISRVRFLKDIETFSLHVSKWKQCYISFWTLLISRDTLLVRLEAIFQGVMKALSVMKLSLCINIKVNKFTSHFS